MAETEQRQYEGMFLISPAVTAEPEAAIKIVRGMLDKYGATVVVMKKWDDRKLAYEIRGQKRGLYIIAYFTAAPLQIVSLERDVTLSEEVLRVMITDAAHMNAEEMNAVEPQPIQPREERNSWDRPSFGSDRPMGDRGSDRGDRPMGDRPPRREPMEMGKE